MKKITIIISMIFCARSGIMAQSTSSAKVDVGSTYVSPVRTDVYPYQSGLHPKVDYSVHFRLNKGTRLTVVAVKDSLGGIIQGYVITPWNFNDTSTIKRNFYKKITDTAQRRLADWKKIQETIQKKQDSLKNKKIQLEKDSLLAVKAKDTLAHSKQAFTNSTNNALNSAISINTKTALTKVSMKTPILKKQINNFKAAQSNIKITLSRGIEPDSLTKQQFIKAAASLPLKNKNIIKEYNDKLQLTKNHLDIDSQVARNASKTFNANKENYEKAIQKLQDLKSKNPPKSVISEPKNDDSKPDPNAYKITKEEKNDSLDAPQNKITQAALYDELEYLDSWANGWQFFVTAKDFSQFEPIYPDSYKFTWGFLTLPVKMRFDNNRGGRFDFEQNLNFGLTFGAKHQLVSSSDISLNYLAGIAVVNVPLDDATADKAATSTSAISTSLGFMFQYEKFQIGVFLGKDFAGAHADQFNYQGKPWLGFAIGVSLFGEGKTTASSQTQSSNP